MFVWKFADVMNGLVLLGVLWGPVGVLLYRFVRPGCTDSIGGHKTEMHEMPLRVM